jgi:hypothetical protein
MYKGRRVPEGRMIRGEREIALTTPGSLTAFQPSLGRNHLSYGSSPLGEWARRRVEHEHSLPDVAFGLAAGSSVASEVGSTIPR